MSYFTVPPSHLLLNNLFLPFPQFVWIFAWQWLWEQALLLVCFRFSHPSLFFFQTFLLNDISHHSLTLLLLDLAYLPGGTQLHHCPVQPYIPIYLIVLGVSGILSLILTFLASTRKDRKSCIITSTALCVVHFFNFCWLIAGGAKWQQCKLFCVFKALK